LNSSDIDNNRIRDEIRAKKDAVNSVLVSFTVRNNEGERLPAFEQFCDPPANVSSVKAWEVTCQDNVHSTKKAQAFDHPDQFHAHLSEYRFAVSPFGAGYDCYRTYEILLMGSYPIVKSSQLDGMYQGWPVLIVKDWTGVTPELLEQTYHEFMATTWNLERLYNSYWEQRIYRERAALGGSKRRLKYFLTE
jgi:hypothetical protein